MSSKITKKDEYLITQSSLLNKSISTGYSITLQLYLCTFRVLYTNQNKMLVNNYDQKDHPQSFSSSYDRYVLNLPTTEKQLDFKIEKLFILKISYCYRAVVIS